MIINVFRLLLIEHYDKIRQFEWILRLKISKISIENRIFKFKQFLDTIFRASKSLELTLNFIRNGLFIVYCLLFIEIKSTNCFVNACREKRCKPIALTFKELF